MEKVEVVCDYCGKVIKRKPSQIKRSKHHFCNTECHHEWTRRTGSKKGKKNPLYTQVNILCDNCGKNIERHISRVNRNEHNFCNKKCYGEWQSREQKGKNNPNFKGGEKEVECETCGKIITRTLWNSNNYNHHFCCDDCLGKWLSETRTGEKSPMFGKHLSEETKQMISEANSNPSEETRKKMRDASKKRFAKEEERERMREMRKNQTFPTHHTKPELIFIDFYRLFGIANRVEDTSNNSFHIGRLNPDFIIRDMRIAIFVNGDYWHSPLLRQNIRDTQRVDYQIKICKRHKWKAVIIWESDLLREDAEQFILKKLKKRGLSKILSNRFNRRKTGTSCSKPEHMRGEQEYLRRMYRQIGMVYPVHPLQYDSAQM